MVLSQANLYSGASSKVIHADCEPLITQKVDFILSDIFISMSLSPQSGTNNLLCIFCGL